MCPSLCFVYSNVYACFFLHPFSVHFNFRPFTQIFIFISTMLLTLVVCVRKCSSSTDVNRNFR